MNRVAQRQEVSNEFALNKGTSEKTEQQWHNIVYLYLGQIQLIALERILLKVRSERREGDQEQGGCLSLRKIIWENAMSSECVMLQ